MSKIWVVAHQLPRDRIVGLFRNEIDADAKVETISDDHCVITYPCEENMLHTQSGYNRRLIIR